MGIISLFARPLRGLACDVLFRKMSWPLAGLIAFRGSSAVERVAVDGSLCRKLLSENKVNCGKSNLLTVKR